jgi:hypothetical protein
MLVANMTLPLNIRSHRQAAIFEAERLFPFSAEEMLVSFESDAMDETVFLATNREVLDRIYATLYDLNADVVATLPASIALAVKATNQRPNGIGLVSIRWEGSREEIEFVDHRLVGWRFGDHPELHRSSDAEVEHVSGDGRDVGDNFLSAKTKSLELVYPDRAAFDQAIIKVLPSVLASLKRGAFAWNFKADNFERSPLEQRGWIPVGLATTLLMLVLGGICYLRSASLDRYTNEITSELAQLSTELFPGQRVRSLKNRLDLEAEGLNNRLQRTEELLLGDRTMQLLASWLAAVPNEPIVEISRADFKSNAVVIEGSALKLDDVSKFVNICKEGGMKVKEDKFGLSFSLTMMNNADSEKDSSGRQELMTELNKSNKQQAGQDLVDRQEIGNDQVGVNRQGGVK